MVEVEKLILTPEVDEAAGKVLYRVSIGRAPLSALLRGNRRITSEGGLGRGPLLFYPRLDKTKRIKPKKSLLVCSIYLQLRSSQM